MARKLTNDYNKSLKPYGVNSTQIPILALLNIYKQLETSKISESLNLEQSTLRRNSSILVKKKLIKVINRDINGNLLQLTTSGYNKLKETLPIWKKSNQRGKKLVKGYLNTLKQISK